MTDQERQELSGRLYAHELILNVLLRHFADRQLPGTPAHTEHLDAFVRDLQTSLAAQATRQTVVAAQEAENTVLRLLDASLRKFWT